MEAILIMSVAALRWIYMAFPEASAAKQFYAALCGSSTFSPSSMASKSRGISCSDDFESGSERP